MVIKKINVKKLRLTPRLECSIVLKFRMLQFYKLDNTEKLKLAGSLMPEIYFAVENFLLSLQLFILEMRTKKTRVILQVQHLSFSLKMQQVCALFFEKKVLSL